MPDPVDHERLAELLQALQDYRPARKKLLEILDLPLSNRDPLAEFSEHLVRSIWGGVLAESRVQAGYDLVVPDGRKVQIGYLTNTSEAWTNEHLVRAIPGVELYALVILEGFAVVGVVLFSLDHLATACQLLGETASAPERGVAVHRAERADYPRRSTAIRCGGRERLASGAPWLSGQTKKGLSLRLIAALIPMPTHAGTSPLTLPRAPLGWAVGWQGHDESVVSDSASRHRVRAPQPGGGDVESGLIFCIVTSRRERQQLLGTALIDQQSFLATMEYVAPPAGLGIV